MDTAEQELEALKQWWNENGRTVVIGIVLGLGGVFGWTTYQQRLEANAEALSAMYQQIIDATSEGQHDVVRAQAAAIIESSPKSGYAVLGSLLAARSAYAQKDLDAAKNHLFWVIQNADKPTFKDVARIRLARVLVEENRLNEARANLDGVEARSFSPTVDEIRGDIRMIEGDIAGAREAYRRILSADNVSSATRERVQMKVDDLGTGNENQSAG